MSKARTEPRDIDAGSVETLPDTEYDHPGVSIGGLATYYRLRCIALEATIAALETELDRKEQRLQNVVARYEEILQGRDCGDEMVLTD